MKVLEVNRSMLGKQNQCRQLIELLPDIKGVGFDALYLLPIIEKGELNAVGSPYCIRDFWKLDPDFGTDDDWYDLQKACAQHQLEIWIDWVMNHSSWDHSWMTTNPEWYIWDEDKQARVHPPGTDWTDVVQLSFHHDCVAHFADLALEWISKRGVKGFRCDASYRIPPRVWDVFFQRLVIQKLNARWLADNRFLEMNELGFDGCFSDGPLDFSGSVWNKIYDHDRSAFGILWNKEDDIRLYQMKQDIEGELNWLIGMGMMFPHQHISFFENQDFDPEKWTNWLKQL
jgi:glycosidase